LTLFHVLAAAAVTFVIVRSGIFAWLRRGPKGWVEFISCPLCTGFWVGLGTGIAWTWPDFRGLSLALVTDLVVGGALVGAVALLYTSVIDWLDALERAANRGEKTPDPQTDEIRQLVDEALQPGATEAKPAAAQPESPGEP
jgi:hypothetical protein